MQGAKSCGVTARHGDGFAPLLLVAGAGWTKKQPDGQTHVPEAEALILGFRHATRAPLGGSKSLVDLSGDGRLCCRS